MSNDLHPLSGLIDVIETILKGLLFELHVKKMNTAVAKFIFNPVKFGSNDNKSCYPTMLGWYRAQKAFDNLK